ncbi:MAG: BrnT family toxin [Candidatus Omnitrophica bacterium]|nr:BrnT family toxin [Candidatus Omnitrophota bacterium]
MESLEFIWDNRKDRQNQRKHGVSFEEAKTAFYDENARVIYDPDHSMEEDRFILLGLSAGLRILVVCHCYREKESRIRIISARKATGKEQNQYKENLS